MPKEYVESMFKSESALTTIDHGDGNYTAVPSPPAYRAAVCWGTNEYVQIATVDPGVALGTVESGLYVDLDRRGINDLIRLLRKARDKAYGRDE